MSDLPLAEQFFEADNEARRLESYLDEALVTALGGDYRAPGDWPISHWWYDDYDGSFEATVKWSGWLPTLAQCEAVTALGFRMGWLNYPDDTYRTVGPRGVSGPTTQPPRRPQELKRLAALVAAHLRENA